MLTPRLRQKAAIAMALLLCLWMASCGASKALEAPPPTIGPRKLTTVQLQTEVMALADTFSTRAVEIWDKAAAAAKTPEARSIAHERKIGSMTSALSIATDNNPLSGFCDFVVLVTLQHQAVEMESSRALFEPAVAQEIVDSYKQLDDEAWKMAEGTLMPEQVHELRVLVQTWRERNPDQSYVGFVRLADLSHAIPRVPEKAEKSGASGAASSLLSMFTLDPLASLDPAAREVEQTRMLAERMFFYLQRAPYLFRWQAEGLYGDVTASGQTRTIIEAVDRTSKAAEQISQVAAKLPQDVAVERKAAIDQIASAVTDQRQAVLDELDSVQKPVDSMLLHAKDTAAQLQGLATAVGDTTVKVDQILARFDKPEKPVDPNAPPAKPMTAEDIQAISKDARATVEQVTILTQELQKTLSMPAWKDRQADITTITNETHEHISGLIDQVFTRVLIVVIVAPIVVAGALFAYRRLTRPPGAKALQ
jgi:hypothetical protein